ncbi:MAG: regulatory sensor-transducer, BlaR1/MecR1 family protein [Flavobacterium sp.]|nr:regulatory sensor-transducer, BlaR1/MecR1 family protein [Flavobacterium sp.]
MHQFNRFYLLFGLVFSLVIPFVTIEIIEEITKPIIQNSTIQINQGSIVFVEETNYLPIILWSIYGLVTTLFIIRFLSNLLKIISKINSNKRVDYKNAKLILLEEKVLPHTFLNFIFVNETDYNNRKIEAELFSHELTHVVQKHTFDVLFIELLKTIFWFNPIFIFYKKAIQFNHEFLADEKVIATYNNVSFYQNLLLSKANSIPTYYLTSNLNYSLTKKRLIMMTKTTSQTKAILKKIAIIPFIFGLVFFLCFKTIAQEKTTTPKANKSTKEQPSNEKRDDYYAGVRIMIKDNNQNVKLDKQYEKLTLDEKNKYLSWVPNPLVEKSPTEKEFKDFKDSKKYAIWINEKHVSNDKLNDFAPKDIVYFSGSSVSKNARSKKFPQAFQYHFYTQNHFDENLKNQHKKFSGKKIEIRLSNSSNSPTKTTKHEELIEEQKIVQDAEKTLPDYLGGMQEFYKFFGANYNIPSDFKGNGRIYIQFIVETDGSLSEFQVIRDLGFGTGEEAVRVLKLTPKWIPGKEDGKVVRMKFALPIAIQAKK